MELRLADAIEVLTRTPGTLDALLRGTSPAWHLGNEGEGTFSPFDVVGHLIHGEKTDWMPRLAILLEHGPTRPFDRYDRFAQAELSRGRSLGELLDTFASLRAENLKTLRATPLGADVLAKTGTHPVLGAVTLSQLLAAWVVHDLGHIAQVARVMAKQYRSEVGPWVAPDFLPVLTR